MVSERTRQRRLAAAEVAFAAALAQHAALVMPPLPTEPAVAVAPAGVLAAAQACAAAAGQMATYADGAYGYALLAAAWDQTVARLRAATAEGGRHGTAVS